MNNHTVAVSTEAEMESLGVSLAAKLPALKLIHLRGPLGAGKTTLVRGLLRGLGHRGAVKSPTFTLVEPYRFDSFTLYHFDLYRLKDSEELEFLGFRDYLQGNGVCVIEWPERGGNILPPPDLDVMIEPAHDGRHVTLMAHQDRAVAALREILA
jgi:tRNA threonylcarbamoyladenosine biosynthesis protein TsaE